MFAPDDPKNRSGRGSTKWPTVAALLILLIATAAGWNWVWGLFFLYWSLISFVARQTFIVQVIHRDEHPVLFHLVSISWVLLSVLMVLYDLFPATAALWLGGAEG
ncbi:MAG: hypothetical protein F4148_11230 [Caldilineaceae bacterium SB0675_bin_29]|uniref:Uncharacterized protein n=1 Tax=Caldilineaceae bacterium SB0675_bin_29 TaxID=2605266 RepID=A0A6B1G865_9CHLR|nr:hypothetical protein [Caldilineaceae bacterium SB0675_bin_29]